MFKYSAQKSAQNKGYIFRTWYKKSAQIKRSV